MDAKLSAPVLSKACAGGLLPASGEMPPSALPRLAASVLAIQAPVQWSFGPETDGRDLASRPRRYWLEVSASLSCTCERCLEPVSVALRSRRGFEFFASPGLADRRLKELQELAESSGSAAPEVENIDFMSSEDEATLATLIEDELLLELPMAPKHSGCQPPV